MNRTEAAKLQTRHGSRKGFLKTQMETKKVTGNPYPKPTARKTPRMPAGKPGY